MSATERFPAGTYRGLALIVTVIAVTNEWWIVNVMVEALRSSIFQSLASTAQLQPYDRLMKELIGGGNETHKWAQGCNGWEMAGTTWGYFPGSVWFSLLGQSSRQKFTHTHIHTWSVMICLTILLPVVFFCCYSEKICVCVCTELSHFVICSQIFSAFFLWNELNVKRYKKITVW